MNNFFRFPHTPHIAWLAAQAPRDDKVLSCAEAELILKNEVKIEEKIDGANLGISISRSGELVAQNRGQYLTHPYSGQFRKLTTWLEVHQDKFFDCLGEDLMLFGEWSLARHSLDYENLPDWFLLFDVYDRYEKKFWSTSRRDALAAALNLATVPILFSGHITLLELKAFLMKSKSKFRRGSLEGLIIRQETLEWLTVRTKLVRPDFIQGIEDHWTRRPIEQNRVSSKRHR
jgi:ATP-dependent RNA circularization protein (DNA/RNA ligase family)